PLSPDAELSIGDIYFTDLDDTGDARAAYESFLKAYRHSERAVYARDQLKMLDADATSSTREKAVSETLGPESMPPAYAGEEPKAGGPAMVTSVRRWVGPNYTRIVINVNGEVQFDARRLVSPDRLVFDLENARPDASLVG